MTSDDIRLESGDSPVSLKMHCGLAGNQINNEATFPTGLAGNIL
jgi:hypothetical protein